MSYNNLVTPFDERPEMIAASTIVFQSAYDVRGLLQTSEVGRRWLRYGKIFSDETMRIASDNPELGSRIFESFMVGLMFARAMERESLGPGNARYDRPFTAEELQRADAVAEEVRSRTNDPHFVAAIDDMRAFAARFVGLLPAEALAVFRESAPQSPGYSTAE